MKIIITAGPTREYLDPVRFLSNPSTGKMGFAVAAEAARRGHDVTLVAGPVSLKTPKGVKRIDVVSAKEMLAVAIRQLRLSTSVRRSPKSKVEAGCGVCPIVFISTAAVADWRPMKCAAKKLKKGQMSSTLKLVRNPDILKTLARLGCGRRVRSTRNVKDPSLNRDFQPSPLVLIGFAAETNDILRESARKCREKHLSFIVANDVTKKGCGFGTDTNKVTFVFSDGTQKKFPLMTKRLVAKRILDEVSRI